jgi:hypothetical protein
MSLSEQFSLLLNSAHNTDTCVDDAYCVCCEISCVTTQATAKITACTTSHHDAVCRRTFVGDLVISSHVLELRINSIFTCSSAAIESRDQGAGANLCLTLQMTVFLTLTLTSAVGSAG